MYSIIRSVGVAVKMPLPPGRARAFEAAGKQNCAYRAQSRKRRTGFISRQGVYESSVSRPTPGFWPFCPEVAGLGQGHTCLACQ